MSGDWPRLIRDEEAGKEHIRVEAEIDDSFVLHVTGEDHDPADDSVQFVGMTLRFPAASFEAWVYLPEDAALRLRDALNEYIDWPVRVSVPAKEETRDE